MLTIVCVSDTHGHHAATDVPPGDVLIHAGDLTMFGTLGEVDSFNAWLGSLPHTHKVVVAGNHDWCFQRSPADARRRLTNATYLEDEAAEVAGLKVYGSPWQPWFHDWAFNARRGDELLGRRGEVAGGAGHQGHRRALRVDVQRFQAVDRRRAR